MGRAFVFAAVMGLMPEACAKLLGQQPAPTVDNEPPPPPPPPSTTTPPIFVPPELGGPQPSATPFASPELTKARVAAEAKDYKKVRAILEKKVKAGKSNREEGTLLLESCSALKDKPCVEACKKAHPELEGI